MTAHKRGVLCDIKSAMGRSIDLAGPDWPLDPRRPTIGLFGVEGPWTAPADGGFDEIWPLVLQGRWTVTASEKGGAPWMTQDVLWLDIETYSPVDPVKVYEFLKMGRPPSGPGRARGRPGAAESQCGGAVDRKSVV